MCCIHPCVSWPHSTYPFDRLIENSRTHCYHLLCFSFFLFFSSLFQSASCFCWRCNFQDSVAFFYARFAHNEEEINFASSWTVAMIETSKGEDASVSETNSDTSKRTKKQGIRRKKEPCDSSPGTCELPMETPLLVLIV